MFDITEALSVNFDDWAFISIDPMSLQNDTMQLTYLRGDERYNAQIRFTSNEIIVLPDKQDTWEQHTYEVRSRLHEGMPEYRFVATGITKGIDEGVYGFIIGLEAYDENGSSILSADFLKVFNGEEFGYQVYNEMMDTMGLHVVDVNFDGYKDVIILNNFAGAHGNTWYDCWLWNVETSSFLLSKSFSKICNPALDPEKKCIYSTGGSGAAYWGGSIYQFIDGSFVITNDLDTGMDGLVETKLVNGEMVVVREVSFDEEGKTINDEQEYYGNSELWQLDHPHWYWIGGHHADQWLGGV